MLNIAPVSPTLPAEDLDRALKFYKEKLGISQKGETRFATAVLECGNGTMLVLYERPATKADNTAASFYVKNVEETVKELMAQGVVFEKYDMPNLKTNDMGIAEMDGFKAAWFKDSEGNILGIADMM